MIELQFLFANQTSTLQEAARNYLRRQQGLTATELPPLRDLLLDYIDKASALADRLPLHETEAWSKERLPEPKQKEPPMVKFADAFARILESLPPEQPTHDAAKAISIQKVDGALQDFQVQADRLSQDTFLLQSSLPMSSPLVQSSPYLSCVSQMSPVQVAEGQPDGSNTNVTTALILRQRAARTMTHSSRPSLPGRRHSFRMKNNPYST